VWNDLRRYGQVSPAQRRLLWEAFAALAIARIALALVPFSRIAAWLGTSGAESPATVTPEQAKTAEAVGWAVTAVARRVPWDGRCFAQALDGTVSFGVCEGESAGFEAHAWLRVGARVVTGGAGHERFKAFTTFARERS